jgi:hypothetical protein
MVVCASLVGCATTASITPKLSQNPAACKLHATIRYDGKADYLPAALINDESAHGAMAFRYSFEAQYGLHEYNAFLVAVNPLSLVGFPTGNDNLVVVGRVDLMRGETVVRTYAAVASLKRTDLRRRGNIHRHAAPCPHAGEGQSQRTTVSGSRNYYEVARGVELRLVIS